MPLCRCPGHHFQGAMIRVPCLLGPGWPGRIPADGRPRLPRAVSHSWTVKQQSVDLLAEGLWEELLDVEQPNITVMDWYVPLHHRPAQPGRTQAPPEAPASRHPPRDPPALPTSVAPSLGVRSCSVPAQRLFLLPWMWPPSFLEAKSPVSFRSQYMRLHQEAFPWPPPGCVRCVILRGPGFPPSRP